MKIRQPPGPEKGETAHAVDRYSASRDAGSGRAARRVIGYYAICPTLVVREDIPKPLAPGMLRATPGWLLPKLALDVSRRGANARQWARSSLLDDLETV
jgi:hypothetical protein